MKIFNVIGVYSHNSKPIHLGSFRDIKNAKTIKNRLDKRRQKINKIIEEYDTLLSMLGDGMYMVSFERYTTYDDTNDGFLKGTMDCHLSDKKIIDLLSYGVLNKKEFDFNKGNRYNDFLASNKYNNIKIIESELQ